MLQRLLLLCGFVLSLALSAAAQNLFIPPTCPPLTGLVTFVEPYGQFYTNIGSKAQLYKGAILQIYRNGTLVGEATVIKVDPLDSIAQMYPPCAAASCLQSGDIAVVKENPVRNNPPRSVPWIEPNLDQTEGEVLIGLFFLYGVGASIVNAN